MKHLFIILSTILITSSLLGQSKTEQEGDENFQKAMEEFKKMDDDSFFGDDDKFQPISNNFSSFKMACFKHDGEEHCLGTKTYSDGIKYVGEFKDGNPNGQGTEISADEEKIYVGNWKEGVKHGLGKQIRSWNRIESNSEETDTEFRIGELKDTEFRIGEWKDGEFFNGTRNINLFKNRHTLEAIKEIYKEGELVKKSKKLLSYDKK